MQILQMASGIILIITSKVIKQTCTILFESELLKALLTGDGLCIVDGGGVIVRIGVLGALGLFLELLLLLPDCALLCFIIANFAS